MLSFVSPAPDGLWQALLAHITSEYRTVWGNRPAVHQVKPPESGSCQHCETPPSPPPQTSFEEEESGIVFVVFAVHWIFPLALYRVSLCRPA